mmetsp:Transcript_61188/g.179445  ORF Transcript_61188/g.179445 Transcript_61188/m.179445 type:complete len:363 (-) Transcript_61188:1128-2216(-)
MLLVARKLWRKLVDSPLEAPRGKRCLLAGPEVGEHVPELLGQLALAACALLSDVAEVLGRQEVLPEQRGVGHALDGGVQEAGVAQILKTRGPSHRRRGLQARDRRRLRLRRGVGVQRSQAVRRCADPLVAFVHGRVVVHLDLRWSNVHNGAPHPLVREHIECLHPIADFKVAGDLSVGQRARQIRLASGLLRRLDRVSRPLSCRGLRLQEEGARVPDLALQELLESGQRLGHHLPLLALGAVPEAGLVHGARGLLREHVEHLVQGRLPRDEEAAAELRQGLAILTRHDNQNQRRVELHLRLLIPAHADHLAQDGRAAPVPLDELQPHFLWYELVVKVLDKIHLELALVLSLEVGVVDLRRPR